MFTVKKLFTFSIIGSYIHYSLDLVMVNSPTIWSAHFVCHYSLRKISTFIHLQIISTSQNLGISVRYQYQGVECCEQQIPICYDYQSLACSYTMDLTTELNSDNIATSFHIEKKYLLKTKNWIKHVLHIFSCNRKWRLRFCSTYSICINCTFDTF